MKLFVYSCFIFLFACFNSLSAQSGWKVATNSPTSERFNDVSFINDSVGFAGQRFFTYKTFDRGKSWIQSAKSSTDLYYRAIEFMDDSLGFVGTLGTQSSDPGLYRTRNGGRTYEEINNLLGDIDFGICGIDHFKNTVIAVGVFHEPAGFFISNDRGETWSEKEVPDALGLVNCLTLSDSVFLISGTIKIGNKFVAGIYKTIDQGNNWTIVASYDEVMTYCWKMNIDKYGRGIASIENGVDYFYTEDFGDSWSIRKVSNVKKHYGGAAWLNDSVGWLGIQWGSGYYETKDGGEIWNFLNFTENMNKIIVMNDGTALACGKRMYIYSDQTSSTHEEPEISPLQTMKIYPSPADNFLYLDVDLNVSTYTRLDLMDANGILIKEISHGILKEGRQTITINTEQLQSGPYFIWFRCNEGHRIFKVLIQH